MGQRFIHIKDDEQGRLETGTQESVQCGTIPVQMRTVTVCDVASLFGLKPQLKGSLFEP